MAVNDPRLELARRAAAGLQSPNVRSLSQALQPGSSVVPKLPQLNSAATAQQDMVAKAAAQFADVKRRNEAIRIAQGKQHNANPGGFQGFLADVLDNPVVQAITTPLQVLDVPRRVVISGIHEISDAIGSGDASWSDFTDQVKDPTYGVGRYVHTGNKWLDRTIGFVGDVALDPLTYATLGASKAGGFSGRVALSGKMLEKGYAAERVADVARMGRAALTAAEIQDLGLKRTGIYFFEKRLGERGRVPGSGGVGAMTEKGLTRMRLAASDTSLGKFMQKAFAPNVNREARIALMRGEVLPGTTVNELVGIITSRDAQRAAMGEARAATQVELDALTHTAASGEVRHTVYQVLDGAREATTPVEVAAAEAWKKWFEAKHGTVTAAMKAVDEEAGFGKFDDYFPHMMTEDARAYMGKPESAFLGELKKGFDDGDPLGVFQTRMISAKVKDGQDVKWFGRKLTADDLTVDRLNQLARDGGFVGDFFETDILKVADKYANQHAMQMGLAARYGDLKAKGVFDTLEAKYKSVTQFDEEAMARQAAIVKEANAAHLEAAANATAAVAAVPKALEAHLAQLGGRAARVTDIRFAAAEQRLTAGMALPALERQLADAEQMVASAYEQMHRIFDGTPPELAQVFLADAQRVQRALGDLKAQVSELVGGNASADISAITANAKVLAKELADFTASQARMLEFNDVLARNWEKIVAGHRTGIDYVDQLGMSLGILPRTKGFEAKAGKLAAVAGEMKPWIQNEVPKTSWWNRIKGTVRSEIAPANVAALNAAQVEHILVSGSAAGYSLGDIRTAAAWVLARDEKFYGSAGNAVLDPMRVKLVSHLERAAEADDLGRRMAAIETRQLQGMQRASLEMNVTASELEQIIGKAEEDVILYRSYRASLKSGTVDGDIIMNDTMRANLVNEAAALRDKTYTVGVGGSAKTYKLSDFFFMEEPRQVLRDGVKETVYDRVGSKALSDLQGMSEAMRLSPQETARWHEFGSVAQVKADLLDALQQHYAISDVHHRFNLAARTMAFSGMVPSETMMRTAVEASAKKFAAHWDSRVAQLTTAGSMLRELREAWLTRAPQLGVATRMESSGVQLPDWIDQLPRMLAETKAENHLAGQAPLQATRATIDSLPTGSQRAASSAAEATERLDGLLREWYTSSIGPYQGRQVAMSALRDAKGGVRAGGVSGSVAHELRAMFDDAFKREGGDSLRSFVGPALAGAEDPRVMLRRIGNTEYRNNVVKPWYEANFGKWQNIKAAQVRLKEATSIGRSPFAMDATLEDVNAFFTGLLGGKLRGRQPSAVAGGVTVLESRRWFRSMAGSLEEELKRATDQQVLFSRMIDPNVDVNALVQRQAGGQSSFYADMLRQSASDIEVSASKVRPYGVPKEDVAAARRDVQKLNRRLNSVNYEVAMTDQRLHEGIVELARYDLWRAHGPNGEPGFWLPSGPVLDRQGNPLIFTREEAQSLYRAPMTAEEARRLKSDFARTSQALGAARKKLEKITNPDRIMPIYVQESLARPLREEVSALADELASLRSKIMVAEPGTQSAALAKVRLLIEGDASWLSQAKHMTTERTVTTPGFVVDTEGMQSRLARAERELAKIESGAGTMDLADPGIAARVERARSDLGVFEQRLAQDEARLSELRATYRTGRRSNPNGLGDVRQEIRTIEDRLTQLRWKVGELKKAAAEQVPVRPIPRGGEVDRAAADALRREINTIQSQLQHAAVVAQPTERTFRDLVAADFMVRNPDVLSERVAGQTAAHNATPSRQFLDEVEALSSSATVNAWRGWAKNSNVVKAHVEKMRAMAAEAEGRIAAAELAVRPFQQAVPLAAERDAMRAQLRELRDAAERVSMEEVSSLSTAAAGGRATRDVLRAEVSRQQAMFDSASAIAESADSVIANVIPRIEKRMEIVRAVVEGAPTVPTTKKGAVVAASKVPSETRLELFRWLDEATEVAQALDANPNSTVHRILANALELESNAALSGQQHAMAVAVLKDLEQGKVVENFWRAPSEGMKELKALGLPGLQSSPAVEKMMIEMQKVEQPAFARVMNQYMGNYTRFFKGYATLSPGFHVRNVIQNSFMMLASGADPRNLSAGFKLWKDMRAFTTELVDGQAQTIEQWLARVPEADRAAAKIAADVMYGSGGGFASEQLSGMLAQGKSKILDNKVLRTSHKVGDMYESSSRFVLAYDSAVKGANLNESAAVVKTFLFDYRDLSAADENMRQVVPFWIWMSRNLPLQLVNQWKNPRAYAIYNSFARNVAEPSMGSDIVPSWVSEQGGVKIGNDLYLRPDLGFNVVRQQLAEMGDPTRLLSYVNPGLRVPVEVLGGRQLYNDVPFSSKPQSLAAGPLSGPLGALASALGISDTNAQGQSVVDPRLNYLLGNMIPPLAQAERLMPATDSRKERQGNSWANYLGVPVTKVTPGMKNSELARRQREIDALKASATRLGYTP